MVVSYATRWLEDATDEAVPERARHAARPTGPQHAPAEADGEPFAEVEDDTVEDDEAATTSGLIAPAVLGDDALDTGGALAPATPGSADAFGGPLAGGRRPTVRERRLAEAAAATAHVEATVHVEAGPVVRDLGDRRPARRRSAARRSAQIVVVEPEPTIPAGAVVSNRLVAGPVAQRVEPVRWWARIRSAMTLTVVSIVLGVLAAAAIGVAVVALFSLLRGAVG